MILLTLLFIGHIVSHLIDILKTFIELIYLTLYFLLTVKANNRCGHCHKIYHR